MIRRSTWGDAQAPEPAWVDTLGAIALVTLGAVAVAASLALARWALGCLPGRLPACPAWLRALPSSPYTAAALGMAALTVLAFAAAGRRRDG